MVLISLLLLLKRKSTGFGDGFYGFVGGHLEKNETIKDAIVREAKEEIGITLRHSDVMFRTIMNRKVNEDLEYIDIVFYANKWQGDIENMEPEKCSELKWCKIDNLPSNLLEFEKYILLNSNSELYFGWEDVHN